MNSFVPQHVWIDKQVLDLPKTQEMRARLRGVATTIIEDGALIKKSIPMTEAKKQLFLTRYQGQVVKKCQGMGDYVCCDYLTIGLVSNCHLECSYCILQDYLKNNPVITVYTNIEEILDQVGNFLTKHPQGQFRVGTGELSDSLALDSLTGFSRQLVSFAKNFPQMTLELKTKSNQIDNLLEMDHGGRTIISWSINPQTYIQGEEHKCSSLEERLEAAQKVVACGYRIGFHFDPLLAFSDWKDQYKNLINELKQRFQPKSIAWISLGSLRYTPGLKTVIQDRWPKSRLLYGELFPSDDGKIRYYREVREELYTTVKEMINTAFPGVKDYLCMETPRMWNQVYGFIPKNPAELEARLA